MKTLNLGALTEIAAELIGEHPTGIACQPSQSSLHHIAGEQLCSFDPLSAQLIAFSSNGPGALLSMPVIAWHFTDEDGRTHLTLSGDTFLKDVPVAELAAHLSINHLEALESVTTWPPTVKVLVTQVKSIRYEVPALDWCLEEQTI